MSFYIDLLSAIQITGALIVERLRFQKIDIGIRKLGHPLPWSVFSS